MIQHLQPYDAKMATQLVQAALAEGLLISVYDGEEYAIIKSSDEAAILKEIGATDADKLIFRTADGTRIGSASLVYGNGPGETVQDHTDHELINKLVAKAWPENEAA